MVGAWLCGCDVVLCRLDNLGQCWRNVASHRPQDACVEQSFDTYCGAWCPRRVLTCARLTDIHTQTAPHPVCVLLQAAAAEAAAAERERRKQLLQKKKGKNKSDKERAAADKAAAEAAEAERRKAEVEARKQQEEVERRRRQEQLELIRKQVGVVWWGGQAVVRHCCQEARAECMGC